MNRMSRHGSKIVLLNSFIIELDIEHSRINMLVSHKFLQSGDGHKTTVKQAGGKGMTQTMWGDIFESDLSSKRMEAIANISGMKGKAVANKEG